MNESGPFQLRWRGKTTGPYSLDEILKQLDEHQIGLWHELGQGAEWTSLGEFLSQREPASSREPGLAERSTLGQVPKKHPAEPPRQGPAARDSEPAAARPLGPPDIIPLPPPVKGLEARRRMLFVALGALFGFTGVHNLYAGYWGTALVQILLTIVTMLLGFGFIVSWVWALIELLVVHTDAKGRRMR